jgi:drug/metabolite transporter (DMT)-like permease
VSPKRQAIWRLRPYLPIWKIGTLLLFSLGLIIFRAHIHPLQGWHTIYPMTGAAFRRVIGYGVVPTVLAVAGHHLAAQIIEGTKRRRMYRAFFVLCAVIGVFLVATAEKKLDDDHSGEVSALHCIFLCTM